MKKKWIILGIIMLMVCSLMSACGSSSNENAKNAQNDSQDVQKTVDEIKKNKPKTLEEKTIAKAEEKGEPVSFTAEEFVKLYYEDQQSFFKKYDGRMIVIKGRVKNVSTSKYSFDKITLFGINGLNGNAYCDIQNDKEEITDLNKNDWVTIKGVGFLAATPSLDYCEIVKVTPYEKTEYYLEDQKKAKTDEARLTERRKQVEEVLKDIQKIKKDVVTGLTLQSNGTILHMYVSNKWYLLSYNEKMYLAQEAYKKVNALTQPWYGRYAILTIYDESDFTVAKSDMFKGMRIEK